VFDTDPRAEGGIEEIRDVPGRENVGRAGHEQLIHHDAVLDSQSRLFGELYVFSAAYGASTSPDLAGYQTALGSLLTDSATTNRLLDVPLYVAIGMDDTAVTGNATTMMAMFNSAGVRTLYQNSTGGHEWGNWRRYLHQTLQLMFKNNSGCP